MSLRSIIDHQDFLAKIANNKVLYLDDICLPVLCNPKLKLIAIISENNAIRLRISVEHGLIANLDAGASVAINGVCLTAVEFDQVDHEKSFYRLRCD